jgi:hypothetical protein
MAKFTLITLLFMPIILLTGCAGHVKFDSGYPTPEEIPLLNYKFKDLVLFTSVEEDNHTIVQSARSADPLGLADQKISLGKIVKNTALKVYRSKFSPNKIRHLSDVDIPGSRSSKNKLLKIHPKVMDFSYGFRPKPGDYKGRPKNPLAILFRSPDHGAMYVPNIRLTMKILFLDKNNNEIFSKNYTRYKDYAPDFPGNHTSDISNLTHQAVNEILIESVSDINKVAPRNN